MDPEDRNREVPDSKPTHPREAEDGSRPDPPRRARDLGKPPSHGSSAPGMRGQRERPVGPGTRGRSKDGGRPRSPSREGLVPAREALEGPFREPTPVEDLPSRQFEREGQDWIVRLAGRTLTGRAVDRGVPLLHLIFFRAREPSLPIRETFSVGDSLDDFGEDQLALAFDTARQAVVPDRPGEKTSP